MPKIHYDTAVKILTIRLSDEKSVDSDVQDNVVLDYDSEGHLVNIDVMEVDLENLVRGSSQEHKSANS